MKALKFICASLIVVFAMSACDESESRPEVPNKLDEPVIRSAIFPELEKAVQGQWVLIQKEEEATGEKTIYSLEDTPFWLRFEEDLLSFRNNLKDGNNDRLASNVSWGEVSIQEEAYPCFFYSDDHNHYVVKEIYDSLLVINDSDAKGVTYKFAKTKESPLSGTNWVLSAFCNTEGDVASARSMTISFDETRYHGRSFVNSFTAAYAVDDSNIRVFDGFTTLVGCECCECELNDRYENAVFKISHFDYTESELKLFYSDTEYMLFYPEPSVY